MNGALNPAFLAATAEPASDALAHQASTPATAGVPAGPPPAPNLEQLIRDWHGAGHSQRAIARKLSIDRRKVKRALTPGVT